MDWGSLLGGAGSLLGGIGGMRGQSSANSENRNMAMMQMQFQERMARHAHQYEVKDLRKAGLNPILSGTGGAGSATPSGSTAKMESVEGAGISSALEALSTITKAVLTKQETEQTKAETENTQARTVTEGKQPGLVSAQTGLTEANTEVSRQAATTAKATQANIAADTRLKEIGSKVALSELNKNNELTKLFSAQGLTQAQQTRLLSLNADSANEVLKGLRTEGAIDESDYGKFLRYLDRALETVDKLPDFGPRGSHSSRDRR